MKVKLPKFGKTRFIFSIIIALVLIASFFYLLFNNRSQTIKILALEVLSMELKEENEELKRKLTENLMKLAELESEDQFKVNKDLKQKIASIENTYKKAVSTYEELLKLKENSNNTDSFDNEFTKAIVLLANQDYEGAGKSLADLSGKISAEQTRIASTFTIPVNVPANNTPPGSGYSRQTVSSDAGSFMVSVVAADLGSTKVIVDTASDSDCGNNCPVLPLATYVSRNGAFAGVNGSYFCPASYPSCAGKTNTFDLLAMNKNKTYFNSDNNVYSNNPVVVFQSGSMRFIGSGSGWGRDTGVDGVLMNYPLLVSGGNVSFGGDDDPKKGSKGNRSFVANKGSTGYIGVVHNATVAEAARVLKTMGVENALNLDNGGSTALWSGGYKVGPGRDLPNVILFVRK